MLLGIVLCGCQSLFLEQDADILRPYSGPSSEGVDRNTIRGKVMVGYQGWFTAEGDGSGIGWGHWTRRRGGDFGPDDVAVDLWPDMSEYSSDEQYETKFRYADGSVATVFSSHDRGVVLRHFQWMKEYGIDGAFVQRFANGLRRPEIKGHKDTLLASAREGAHRFGRAYAVMYDLSGLPEGGVQSVVDDWANLSARMQIESDSAYLRVNDKPLVSVWGVGFSDRGKPRAYTLEECRDLIAFLKDAGCSVMLGIPTYWREGIRDATNNPNLLEVLEMADILSPWTVGRYRNLETARSHAHRLWKPDREWCVARGIDYLPVAFPGFSWRNQNGGELNAIPRLKGAFFWEQVTSAKRMGSDMLYVAMFDEVDEGTAIFKVSDTPPVGEGVAFLDREGLPSDYYLTLAGEAGRLLRDERSLEEAQPSW